MLGAWASRKPRARMGLWSFIGNIASVAGLGLSIWVLIVATGAKRAAQSASRAARRRDLVEELEDLSHKFQQVGTLIHQEQWIAVQMWVDEVTASCRVMLTRWPDHLSSERRNDLMSATTLISSIAKAIASVEGGQFTLQLKKRFADTQIRASGHINSALGEAKRKQERDGEVTNGH